MKTKFWDSCVVTAGQLLVVQLKNEPRVNKINNVHLSGIKRAKNLILIKA